MKVSRRDVLAYRVAAQQLHRDTGRVEDLTILDLGVQEAMGHPAALAFAARLPADVDLSPGAVTYGPGHALAYSWSLRGAPHIHRRADLDTLAAALWPLSEADAAARLNETGPSVARAGIPALEQFETAVREMRAAVTEPAAKGAVSTAVSRALPDVMLRDCRPCKARHISDSAMRTTTLAAGLELEPDVAPPVLRRRPKARLPRNVDRAALAGLARAYARLLGPATAADFAGYLEARRADVREVWPDDLVEVDVEGRTGWIPADCADMLRHPPAADIVRLLGPFDPFMQARDRDLLVPDKAAQKVLWPVLGRPGVLLVEGEVAGVWRTRSAKTKLTITVEAFAAVPKTVWTAVEGEAERVAQVRGVPKVEVARAG